MGKKLTLAISLIDENNKTIAINKSNATWTLNDDKQLDSENDCLSVRDTITDVFTDQLKIDLTKGLMTTLVDEIFDKVINVG